MVKIGTASRTPLSERKVSTEGKRGEMEGRRGYIGRSLEPWYDAF